MCCPCSGVFPPLSVEPASPEATEQPTRANRGERGKQKNVTFSSAVQFWFPSPLQLTIDAFSNPQGHIADVGCSQAAPNSAQIPPRAHLGLVALAESSTRMSVAERSPSPSPADALPPERVRLLSHLPPLDLSLSGAFRDLAALHGPWIGFWQSAASLGVSLAARRWLDSCQCRSLHFTSSLMVRNSISKLDGVWRSLQNSPGSSLLIFHLLGGPPGLRSPLMATRQIILRSFIPSFLLSPSCVACHRTLLCMCI